MCTRSRTHARTHARAVALAAAGVISGGLEGSLSQSFYEQSSDNLSSHPLPFLPEFRALPTIPGELPTRCL
eukprot:2318581-Rhodomonas_salina.1